MIDSGFWIVKYLIATTSQCKAEKHLEMDLCARSEQPGIKAKIANRIAPECHIDTFENINVLNFANIMVMIACNSSEPGHFANRLPREAFMRISPDVLPVSPADPDDKRITRQMMMNALQPIDTRSRVVVCERQNLGPGYVAAGVHGSDDTHFRHRHELEGQLQLR